MLSPTYVLWDTEYSLCTYGYIFIVILIIWQVKRTYQGLKSEPKRSCCRRHWKVRQRSRDAALRVRRHSWKDTETPKELLTVIKSHGWLPQEGSVRRLLCADPNCDICNDVVLDIEQLLVGDSTLLCPKSPEPLRSSSCQEITSARNVSSGQNREHLCAHSKEHLIPTQSSVVTQLKHQKSILLAAAQPTGCFREHNNEHYGLMQKSDMSKVSLDPKAEPPLACEESEASLVNKQTIMRYSSSLFYGGHGRPPPNSQVSLLTLDKDIDATPLTSPVTLHMVSVLQDHPPILSPDILRLLEVHVKKWTHFQRWGLPRRVEESLRQLMPHPPLFDQPKSREPLSFLQNDMPHLPVEKFGTISYQTWGCRIKGQPTQTFWVSEWSIISLELRHHYQQIPSPTALVLPSPDLKELSALYPLPGQRANDSVNFWQEKYSQLFCGLPSLHSESLVDTFLDSHGLSIKRDLPQIPLKEPFFLEGLSFLPLLPGVPQESVPPPAPSSPTWISPPDHQQTQNSVPFLTLDQCEALEWHVLQRQLQLQWGWPAIFQRAQVTLSPIKYKSCDKVQSPETVKHSWSEKSISVFTRELLYFPEHARRLLEFHLQRQLTHHRWGLPPKIQQSIQLLLSPSGQQALSLSNTALENVSISQATAQMPSVVGDLLAHIDTPEPFDMPRLFAQAKAILQNHIDSKCGQIHQGKVPVCVCSSWQYIVTGSLNVPASFCLPESKPLELQATPDPELQKTVMALDQLQASPRAVTKHSKLPCVLPEEAVEKLETTLRHKYLAFLSGLPALYYVALSRAGRTEVPAHLKPTNGVIEPVQILTESPTQVVSPEEQHPSPEPAGQDSNQTPRDAAEETQTEEQEAKPAETPSLDTQPGLASPISLKKPFLNKLNFHVRKKSLEFQLGIPNKARESRDQTPVPPDNGSTQKTLGKPSVQEVLTPPDTAVTPDPKWCNLKQQLTNELKSILQNQKQPSSNVSAHDSDKWVSKVSQPSGDMAQAQVLCVQVEASANNPSFQAPWSPKTQSPGKSKDSTQVLTLMSKRDNPNSSKLAGGHGEGDAGLVVTSTKKESQPAAAHSSTGVPQSRTPHNVRRRNQTFHLDVPGQHSPQRSPQRSPQQSPQLKLPEQLPAGRRGKPSEKQLQDTHTKGKVTLKPARVPQSTKSEVLQRARGPPFQVQLPVHRPPQGHAAQARLLLGPVVPVHTHRRHSLPESGLRNKVKSFLHCIHPQTKDKRDEKSLLLVAEKVPQSRGGNVEKSLPPATSPLGRTKTEKIRGIPKTPCPHIQKKVGVAFLGGLHSPDCKLRQRLNSHQFHSASVLGHRHHCPRHCPRRAFASQLGAHPSARLLPAREIVTSDSKVCSRRLSTVKSL